MRQPLVVANWKMNGSASFAETMSSSLLEIDWRQLGVSVVVAPPYPYIEQLSRRFENTSIDLAVQDVSAHDEGAYTGEVSARMAADVGATFAIVGHSERRAYHNESDSLIASKAAAAMSGDLVPICCVGETLEAREAGQAEAVVGQQINALTEVFAGSSALKKVVLAYEPVWAIGTGKTASPDEAQAMHGFIRRELGSAGDEVPILYGGSVKAENSAELFSQRDIDGGLIGGASLVPEDFIEICRSAKVK